MDKSKSDPDANVPKREESKEEVKGDPSDPWKQFERTNFEFLYDSFHQPLTDIVSQRGEIIGLNTKGEFRRFEHTEITRAIEEELAAHAKARNVDMLELRLAYHFNLHNGTLNDTLKYILCFYKVRSSR